MFGFILVENTLKVEMPPWVLNHPLSIVTDDICGLQPLSLIAVYFNPF